MNWLIKLLTITGMVSPEIKLEIRKTIDQLTAAAQRTKLPADDLAVGILKALCILTGLY